MDDKILEGTTTVGITCEDGVVFASERRASMGNLVAHKVAEKIFKIDDHIVTTIAGSVGDAQSLMKIIEDLFNDGELTVENTINRLISMDCDLKTISEITGLSENEIKKVIS